MTVPSCHRMPPFRDSLRQIAAKPGQSTPPSSKIVHHGVHGRHREESLERKPACPPGLRGEFVSIVASNSLACTILSLTLLLSVSCKENRKLLKKDNLPTQLTPMFGRFYGQINQDTDLTIFMFLRFFLCHIPFVSTS